MALGAKRLEPRLPLGTAVGAVFVLDLIWPVLLLVGVERVRVNPQDTAFTNLAFESYPWSHSLAMVLVWSVLAAALGWRLLGTKHLGIVIGLLVLSHWVLDLVTHRPDLPLWPAGPLVGLGLWNSIVGTIVTEGALLAIGTALYANVTGARDRIGALALYSLIGLCTVLWISQPWSPLPPSASAVAWGALILWLLPPWSHWVERHRFVRGGSEHLG